MNVEEFREYCLSLPDVTEATPFEKFSKGKFTILVFYVNSHMFCYFNVDDFSNITIKCESSEMAELKEHYQAVRGRTRILPWYSTAETHDSLMMTYLRQ